MSKAKTVYAYILSSADSGDTGRRREIEIQREDERDCTTSVRRYPSTPRRRSLIEAAAAAGLRARAEAAEAERDEYKLQRDKWIADEPATEAEAARLRDECSRAEMAAIYFEARVAELEAQLAAQGWRPVTADWPPRTQRVVISAPGASWADVARKQHDGEEYVWQLKNGHMLDFESATVATPLPPAPAPQEPTP